MTDINSQENKDLLSVHPDDLAVEVDENPRYNPSEDSNVVVLEPTIISIGRANHVKDLRTVQAEPRQD